MPGLYQAEDVAIWISNEVCSQSRNHGNTFPPTHPAPSQHFRRQGAESIPTLRQRG